jgi:hypothetical protein
LRRSISPAVRRELAASFASGKTFTSNGGARFALDARPTATAPPTPAPGT